MNNTTLQIKFKQRLNKIASNDYDNIECWQIVEAFNKAQISWCRRQLHGTNQYREGDEASKKRIDDLQILLTSRELTGPDITYDDQFGYFRADNFAAIYDPTLGNYLEFKRIEAKAVQAIESQPAVPEIPAQFYTAQKGYYYYVCRNISEGATCSSAFTDSALFCDGWIDLDSGSGGISPNDWNIQNADTTTPPAEPIPQGSISGQTLSDNQASTCYIPNINPDSPFYIGNIISTETMDAYPEMFSNFDQNGFGPINQQSELTVQVPGTGIAEIPATEAQLAEVANTDIILRDPLKNPDFEWGESFCTIQDNEIRVWRKDFFIVEPRLHYYRKPTNIQILGCVDPYTGTESTLDIQCEFKDDIAELMIDEAISIIAGDISDPNQFQRGDSLMEKNN